MRIVNSLNKFMKKNYLQIIFRSLLLSLIGVFVIDYFFHLFFSKPMETVPYFLAKLTLYIVFSFLFLAIFKLERKEFIKVLIAGIAVASLWGMYYNVFPIIFGYYPFGIPLRGLTFLGMSLFGTGLAFGTVHTLAFMGGYYATKFLFLKKK